jgi:16S rRNA (adenine1518-N6/adenine1519-N6)-dimethyltransferase
MVILLQKEVAKRIVASDGKESILSLSVKAYGKPRYIKTVKAGNFIPKPRVASALLLIDDISRSFFQGCGVNHGNRKLKQKTPADKRILCHICEKTFFAIVKKGFSGKRKQLVNNLKSVIPDIAEVLKHAGIHPRARAEDLTLNDWKKLVEAVDLCSC